MSTFGLISLGQRSEMQCRLSLNLVNESLDFDEGIYLESCDL
jgi:hypothetical protein